MGIAVVVFIMIFVPSLLNIDGFSGGFAISFVSVFGARIHLLLQIVLSWVELCPVACVLLTISVNSGWWGENFRC
jgi:hypothetical protein